MVKRDIYRRAALGFATMNENNAQVLGLCL